MSKVRIYGDVSGYVDIAVPDNAGTTTLNLDKIPQADINGNIAMDTNTLYVDAANNRVGVGTASPNTTLDIVSPSGAEAINIRGRSADDIGQLKFYENDGTTSLARLDSRTTHFEVGSYNELRFSAGGVGNSHVVIDTSGRVGIGTTSPDTPLHVRKAGNPNGGNRNTVETVLTLDATGYYPYGGYGVGIDFKGEDYGNTAIREYAKIEAVMVGHSNQTAAGDSAFTSALTFATNSGGASSTLATEKMRIDDSGNVGIGVTDPDIKLHTQIDTATEWTGTANLSNTTNKPIFALLLDNNDSSITNTEVNMLFSAGASGSGQHSIGVKRTGTNTGDMIFRRRTGGSSSAETMRIDSSGRLTVSSIGTDTTLSGGQPGLQVTGSGFNGYMAAVRRDSSIYSSGLILAKSRNSTADNFTALQDNDQIGSIIFIGDDGTDLDTYGARIQAEVNGTPSNNNMPADLIFSTNPGTSTITERMRITKDGKVGINTTQARTKLAIQTPSTGSPVELINLHNPSTVNGSGTQLTFSGFNGESTYPTWRYGGISGLYDTASSGLNAGGWGGKLNFFVNRGNGPDAFENVITITGGGHTIIPAGVTLGTSVGVYSAANTLDDYEEGLHTYTLKGANSGNATIPIRSGYTKLAYTKIGRMVTVTGKIETSGSHSATGALRLSLPFTAANLSDQAGVAGGSCFIYRTSQSIYDNPAILANTTSPYAIFYYNTTSGDVAAINANNLDAAFEILVSFSYFTNA